ncbi:MAG TPA: CDP-diacylglycerol--serine O-phosphatidyltransferase [Candidatus Omnitrophota bacterium]|nr:CDP-diacylglycerol--serine O-phosphatidyltransferase [Candidatus Omnitrophota bacterium]HPS37575.1 CDP-diacylglycerol--serine O-phosphatidyltransferase [Candidatus Omnitrophota bacterium]
MDIKPKNTKSRFYFATAAFPNMITMLNLISGFFSILMSINGKYEFAAWLVLLALVLDSFDGHVARIFGNETIFGRELDSLSDAVSFVLAPCVFVAMLFTPKLSMVMLLVILLYLCSGIFRLARFNVNPTTAGGAFEGLPTPAAALTLLMTLVAFHKNHWESHTSYCLVLMTALAFLMSSDIPYPKISAIKFRSWRTLFVVQLTLLILTYVYLNIESAIAIVFLAFLILSPFYCMVLSDQGSSAANGEKEES